MESTPPINPSSEAPKSNRNMIIGVVIAVVLCCCCVVTGAGGYYGYQAYVAAQQAVQQFDDIQIPEIPSEIPSDIPFDPNQLPVDIGEVPQGGLSDDTPRYSAWLSVQLVGMMSGCETPTAATTTISVVDQPDSSGVWKEAWNVDCGNGSFKSYNITFTPENGVVSPTVELP